MRVLTLAESRQLDRRAIDELGLPAAVLMENAALGVADALGASFPRARRVLVYCGPGNNGGDGLAVARQLDARGYDVEVRLARFGATLSGDCAAQLEVARRLGLDVRELVSDGEGAGGASARGVDVVVDALFGAGLTRPLAGPWAELVSRINELGRSGPAVVAVDLPSGLDGDRAAPIGPCVRADLTITFVAPKPALVLRPACEEAGEVVVADLGFRVDPAGGPGTLHRIDPRELGAALAPRAATAHKGDFGHVLLVAGSAGMAGAAVLAARAAVVAGAGRTTVACPGAVVASLAAGCPEAMTLVADGDDAGRLGPAALPALLAAVAERDVVAVGPGLGRAGETGELVRALAAAAARPLVLDADGLSAFAGRLEEMAARTAPTVLTPHPGELARLLGRSTPEVQADRLAAAREAARRAGAVVALKGDRSIVAAPDGEAWVNASGNPAMATGGSGDVLTGLLAARLAQGDEPEFAAVLSVHLHGAAGDLALERLGSPAIPAGDLAAILGEAWKALQAG